MKEDAPTEEETPTEEQAEEKAPDDVEETSVDEKAVSE